MNELVEFFTRLRIPGKTATEYASILIDHGFDDIRAVEEDLTVDDLESYNFKPGHIKRIEKAIGGHHEDTKCVLDWKVCDCVKWLCRLFQDDDMSLRKCIKIFVDGEVDGKRISKVHNDADLQSLGIESQEHRHVLMKHIRTMRSDGKFEKLKSTISANDIKAEYGGPCLALSIPDFDFGALPTATSPMQWHVNGGGGNGSISTDDDDKTIPFVVTDKVFTMETEYHSQWDNVQTTHVEEIEIMCPAAAADAAAAQMKVAADCLKEESVLVPRLVMECNPPLIVARKVQTTTPATPRRGSKLGMSLSEVKSPSGVRRVGTYDTLRRQSQHVMEQCSDELNVPHSSFVTRPRCYADADLLPPPLHRVGVEAEYQVTPPESDPKIIDHYFDDICAPAWDDAAETDRALSNSPNAMKVVENERCGGEKQVDDGITMGHGSAKPAISVETEMSSLSDSVYWEAPSSEGAGTSVQSTESVIVFQTMDVVTDNPVLLDVIRGDPASSAARANGGETKNHGCRHICNKKSISGCSDVGLTL